MKIEIFKWACEGFRCPDMEIDLRAGQHVPRVTLVQMPNGTGKTTTLNLLKATLTGDAKHWSQNEIKELSREGETRDLGVFSVELSVDGRPLKLELRVDFTSGAVAYATTSPEVGGYNRGWTPPSSVRRFLNRKFVDLFIFDGELANRLLKPEESRAEEAIETLCQLDLLNQVRALAELYWQKATTRAGSTTVSGLSRYQSISRRLSERLRALKLELAAHKAQLEDVKLKIEARKSKIDQRLESDEQTRGALQSLSVEKATTDKAIESTLGNLMLQMRLPQALSPSFVSALHGLKQNLDRVKLPDSTSRQFFTELANESVCVCGRPIAEHERQVILSSAEEFLGEDLAGVLNSLKHDIDLVTVDENYGLLQTTLSNLRVSRARSAAIETEIGQLTAASLSASGEDLNFVQSEIDNLKVQEAQITDAIEVIESPLTVADQQQIGNQSEVDLLFGIAAVEKQVEMARAEIAKISNTLNLKNKIDLIEKITKEAQEIARNGLKQVLIDNCNLRLKTILKGDPIFIDKIEKSLVLKGRSSGSVGQNLAIGYTFLAEALHRGSHVFPLIVDSPAGPLDGLVRPQIASMVPQLCNQFIAFTISTEREAFLEPLEAAANGDIRYLTAFRKTEGNSELMRNLPQSTVDNRSSNVVEGRDYFVQFAKEEEVVGGER